MAVVVKLGTAPERSITVDRDGPAGRVMLTFCTESCNDLRNALAHDGEMSWAIPPTVLAAIKGKA